MPALATAFFVLLIAGAFVGAVYLFRMKGNAADAPSPLPEGGTRGVGVADALIPRTAIEDREAALYDVRDSLKVGVARRGVEDGKPYFEIVMNPPAIDRETHAYEAWIVRPVPYDYFSVGEMVTNDLGEFVVRWEGEKGTDVDEYTRVVVTLEAKDGNPDPGEQVIKGVFGAD